MSELSECLSQISTANDADVYILTASIETGTADNFIHLLRRVNVKKNNCILLLTTYGGDPDAGYTIVRAIKNYYSKFILYVFGFCKSTGTLMALGADEIVMSDFGEFGPLDIQLAKDDEFANTSGLSYVQSLISLNNQMMTFFIDNFFAVKQSSANTISTKTAAEIASKLAIGLTSPISSQLNPIKLGEVERAIKIADAYGSRLTTSKDLISKLVTDYPSHGFVIDFAEASELFPNVRKPTELELLLEYHTFNMVRDQGSIVDILISTEYFWGKIADTQTNDEGQDENTENTTDVVGENAETTQE